MSPEPGIHRYASPRFAQAYLQDVGSTFGMCNDVHEWDLSYEYFFDAKPSRKRLVTFGFGLSPWQTIPYQEYPAVGKFEGDRFDPITWQPQTPTEAYIQMRADDAFWAARRVGAFTDELIRAAVSVGQFSNPEAEKLIGDVLIKRRDKILEAFLPAVNPVIDPALDRSGRLTFGNAAVAAGVASAPTAYRATWYRFDNATGDTAAIGTTEAATPAMLGPSGLPTELNSHIAIDISAVSSMHLSWTRPVRVSFRHTAAGWQLLGLNRLPAQIESEE